MLLRGDQVQTWQEARPESSPASEITISLFEMGRLNGEAFDRPVSIALMPSKALFHLRSPRQLTVVVGSCVGKRRRELSSEATLDFSISLTINKVLFHLLKSRSSTRLFEWPARGP